MLEHLDRDDPVEAPIGLEDVDVRRHDLDVCVAEAVDVCLLRLRVGHREYPTAGISLGDPPGKGAPAAPEVEDLHSVHESCAGAREREHRLLGVRERLDTVGPEAARVLPSWSEREPEELRRQLVVLVVRRCRLDRDRPARHRGDHLLEGVEATKPLTAQPKTAVLRDRGAKNRIRQETPPDDAVGDHAAGFRFGGNGTNTETSSW